MEVKNISRYHIALLGFFLWGTLVVTCVSVLLYSDISLYEYIALFQNYVHHFFVFSILIFMMMYVLRPLFFIIVPPFDLLSGIFFGPLLGVFVSSGAIFVSTMFSYIVGKYTGSIIFEKISSPKIQKIHLYLSKNTFKRSFSLRFFFLPYDLSNYISGTMAIPFWKYVAGTTLGMLPTNIVFVVAGASFYGKEIQDFSSLWQEVDYRFLILASFLFFTSMILTHILRRHNTPHL